MKDIFDYREKSLIIYSVIRENLYNPDYRMGVAFQRYWDILAQILKQNGFTKPLLKNNRDWVKEIVIKDFEAFFSLAAYIKIELIVDGKIRFWNGYGMETTWFSKLDADDPRAFLREKGNKALLEFLLGTDHEKFKNILEEL